MISPSSFKQTKIASSYSQKYYKIAAVEIGEDRASTHILSIAKLLPTDVVGFDIAIAIWWIRAAVDLANWRSVVLRFQSKMEG